MCTGEEGAGGADQGPKADNIYVLTEITYGVRCFYMHLFIQHPKNLRNDVLFSLKPTGHCKRLTGLRIQHRLF